MRFEAQLPPDMDDPQLRAEVAAGYDFDFAPPGTVKPDYSGAPAAIGNGHGTGANGNGAAAHAAIAKSDVEMGNGASGKQ